MPYSISRARRDAQSRIKDLRGPFVYAKLRTRKLPTNIRDSVFQNCVFQLSAVLEDYLFQLTSSWFDKLTSGGAPSSAIPTYTRMIALLKWQEESFNLYMGLGDEAKFADRVSLDQSVYSLAVETQNLPSFDFQRFVLKDKKFPSIRNFERFFQRLGIPNIYRILSRRTRSSFDFNLRSFMDVRNALAHESPPSITDVDVGDYFVKIETWVEQIDRVFYSHVVKASGATYWSAMEQ